MAAALFWPIGRESGDDGVPSNLHDSLKPREPSRSRDIESVRRFLAHHYRDYHA